MKKAPSSCCPCPGAGCHRRMGAQCSAPPSVLTTSTPSMPSQFSHKICLHEIAPLTILFKIRPVVIRKCL